MELAWTVRSDVKGFKASKIRFGLLDHGIVGRQAYGGSSGSVVGSLRASMACWKA